MNTKEFFSERYAQALAKDADEVRKLGPDSQGILRGILELVGDKDAKVVLDYGCGLGKFYGFLKALTGCEKYIGVDVVPAVIRANKEYFGIDKGMVFKTLRGEIKDKVDSVWTASTLQHMDDAAVEKALANFAKILNVGGRLVVWVNTTTSKPDLPYMKRRSRDDYIGMIEEQFGKMPIVSKAFPVGDEEITVMVVKKK